MELPNKREGAVVKPKKNNKIKIVSLLTATNMFVCFYFAGMLHSLMTGCGPTYSVFKMSACMSIHGFPKTIFWFAFFVLSISELGYFINYSKAQVGMDKMGRLFKMSNDRKVYGDSHFEEPEEYQKAAVIQPPEKAYGTILGQLDDSGENIINFRMDSINRLNKHIAVIGPSGTGKTYSFSKPFIFQACKRRESVVITDPDGGLYRDTAGYFEDNGYIVKRFDLANLHKSDGWDCLKAIRGNEINAQLFAQTIMSNSQVGNADIYSNGPMSLMKAISLRVILGRDYEDERKNIRSVYELLQNPMGEEFLDMMFDPASLTKEEKPCLGPYASFKQGSGNLRGNIITGLSTLLQLLQNDIVCDVLSTDDIDLELPAKQPCAYYCVFPDSHDTFKFIVSLFFSMIFTTLISFADSQPSGRCPVPVNFLLDEFPSIGIIPDFHRKMSTIRKRDMNCAMIFQDITQLQTNYPMTWLTLLSNCSTVLILGINDDVSAGLYTKRIGDTTVEVKTEQHAAMESLFAKFKPYSTGDGRRSLLAYEELFKLGEDECVIVFQQHDPIWAFKYPYSIHPEAIKLRTILPVEIPDLNDEAARNERRKKQTAFVGSYLRAHPLGEVDRSYAGRCEGKYGSYNASMGKVWIRTSLGRLKELITHIVPRREPFVGTYLQNSCEDRDVDYSMAIAEDVVIEEVNRGQEGETKHRVLKNENTLTPITITCSKMSLDFNCLIYKQPAEAPVVSKKVVDGSTYNDPYRGLATSRTVETEKNMRYALNPSATREVPVGDVTLPPSKKISDINE